MIEQETERLDVPEAPQVRKYAKPTSALVVITREIAEEWLGLNVKNRAKRDTGAETYGRDLSSGAWMLNGATIVFDWFGNLIDGQHRLWACAESGIPFETFVVWGVDPEAQKTLDTGMTRTFQDELKLAGIDRGSILDPLAGRVFHWNPPINARVKFHTKKVSSSERRKILYEHQELHHCAEFVDKLVGNHAYDVSKSMLAFIYWILLPVNGQEAPVFLRKLVTGVGLEEGDPILRLRERLARDAKKGKTRKFQLDTLWLSMSAWNHWMAGRQLDKLQLPTDISDGNWPKLRSTRKSLRIARPNFSEGDSED